MRFSPLDVRRLDGDRWEVLSPFFYDLDRDDFGYVKVHKGFVTDFASIPLPFSMVLQPIGKSWDLGAVIHDFLYWLPYVWTDYDACREITRAEADRIFLDAMKACGTPLLIRYVIYAGVRAGGSIRWNKYRQESKLAEQNTT